MSLTDKEMKKDDWYAHTKPDERLKGEPLPPEEIRKWYSKDASKLASLGRLNEAESLIARPAALSDMEQILDNIDRPEIDMVPTGVYPPTNVIRTDAGYRVEIAVAGFSETDFSITVEDGSLLMIKANPKLLFQEVDYVSQGISKRRFQRSFTLAKGVEVIDSILKDGILTINLSRHVPEPQVKVIPINKKPELLMERYKVDPRLTGTPPTYVGHPQTGVTGVTFKADANSWLWPHNSISVPLHDGAQAAPLSPSVNISVEHK